MHQYPYMPLTSYYQLKIALEPSVPNPSGSKYGFKTLSAAHACALTVFDVVYPACQTSIGFEILSFYSNLLRVNAFNDPLLQSEPYDTRPPWIC